MSIELRVVSGESFIPNFLTVSRKMKEGLSRLWRHSSANTSIFLNGETGTGKTTLARDIHAMSSRAKSPFVVVDCASIPQQLFESEIFGHKKGAFTSAFQDHTGLIETANGGTVFLDEISEISPETQAKLLRVVQEGIMKRVGDTKEIPVDIRWVSATHANLAERIENKTFRADLYYRLCQFTLEIPPLRERREDIEIYADQVFDNYSTTLSERCSAGAIRAILDHSWAGNVRQLISVLNVAHIDCVEEKIQSEDFNFSDSILNSTSSSEKATHGKPLPICVGYTVDEATKLLVMQTLLHCEKNISLASSMLGINHNTLRTWLKKWERSIANI